MNKIKVEISGKRTIKRKTEYLSFGIHDEDKIRGGNGEIEDKKTRMAFFRETGKNGLVNM